MSDDLIAQLMQELDAKQQRIAYYENLLSSLPGVIYWKDKYGRYIHINEEQAVYFGKHTNDVVGKTDFALGRKEQAREWSLNDQSVILHKKSTVFVEKYINAKKPMYYMISAKRPWRDAEGNIVGVVGVSFPYNKEQERLSELQDARQKAEEKLEEKNRFIQAFSHDARTPLAGMIGLIRSLEDDFKWGLKAQHKLTMLKSTTEQYLLFLNNVLETSEKSPFVDAKADWFSTGNMLEEIEAIYAPSCVTKGINLQVNNHHDSWKCLGHGLMIKRMVCNLISNAIKFTEKGKVSLYIRADPSNSSLYIVVEDTGKGMDNTILEGLFEKFYTHADNNHQQHTGLGLGLYMTKRYAEFLNGSIKVRSKLHDGSQFSMCIPVEQLKQENACDRQQRRKPKKTLSITFPLPLLVIEDSPLPVLALSHMLEKIDKKVVIDVAISCQQAIDFVMQKKYALIFFDIGLPDRSGIVFAKRSQNTPLNQDTPLVALSGYSRRHVEKIDGIYAYYTKPIQHDDLMDLVGGLFKDCL